MGGRQRLRSWHQYVMTNQLPLGFQEQHAPPLLPYPPPLGIACLEHTP